MRVNLRVLLSTLTALTAVIGCDFNEKTVQNVVAEVNGSVLTVDDARARVDLSLSLIRTFYPKALEQQADYLKTRDGIAVNIPRWWVDSVLLRQAAKEVGISAEDANLEACRQTYLAGHNFKGSYEEFLTFTRVDRKILDYDIETEVLKKAVILHHYPDLRGFTDEQVAEVRARYVAFNQTATQGNAEKFALASNVWQQIRAGMDFVAAGEKYGELFQGQEKTWKKLTPADFGDEKLKSWAFSAQVGEVSAPLDLDDGISLVKVLAKKDGVIVETPLAQNMAEADLARITFKALATVNMPTDAELREKMLKTRTQESEAEFFGKLRTKAQIAYPQGEDFIAVLYPKGKVVQK